MSVEGVIAAYLDGEQVDPVKAGFKPAKPGVTYYRNVSLHKRGPKMAPLAQHVKSGRTSVTLEPTVVVELAILAAIAYECGPLNGLDKDAKAEVLTDYVRLNLPRDLKWTVPAVAPKRKDVEGHLLRTNKAHDKTFAKWLIGLGFDLDQAIGCLAADKRTDALYAVQAAVNQVRENAYLSNRLAVEAAERLADLRRAEKELAAASIG